MTLVFTKLCCNMQIIVFAIARFGCSLGIDSGFGFAIRLPSVVACRSYSWSICASTPQRHAVNQQFESPWLHSVKAKSTQFSLSAFRCGAAFGQVIGAPVSQP